MVLSNEKYIHVHPKFAALLRACDNDIPRRAYEARFLRPFPAAIEGNPPDLEATLVCRRYNAEDILKIRRDLAATAVLPEHEPTGPGRHKNYAGRGSAKGKKTAEPVEVLVPKPCKKRISCASDIPLTTTMQNSNRGRMRCSTCAANVKREDLKNVIVCRRAKCGRIHHRECARPKQCDERRHLDDAYVSQLLRASNKSSLPPMPTFSSDEDDAPNAIDDDNASEASKASGLR